MAAKRRQEHVDAQRDKGRGLALWALACWAWSALGILCMAWSVHTTDLALGRLAFYAGLGIGNGGILFTALAAYRWGERHGHW
jgi:hypothetical protein